ncbi:MAG: cytochrome c oxidase accessory protein CcoG [Burkholderiaceae bacterium]
MTAGTTTRKIIPIEPVAGGVGADAPEMVSLFEAAKKIYPRSVSGRYSNWRWLMVWATQLFFYGVPWLQWGERQVMLFDLEARRFYLFGLVLYPQDFIYLTGLLVMSALALFLFTAVAGRLWCGFSCPQTVYTEMFLWIEHKIEGDRTARMKLDAQGFSAAKLLRKSAKHAVWIALGLWTGFTFVGYFTPIRELAGSIATFDTGPWEAFWVLFYGFATYGNAGFLREQVCKYMCPYARFQSAMFDKDTLVVGYDVRRGEPRGARSKKTDRQALQLGDCVSCTLCVQVCPTGIDIREGLQYECISCGACADICDGVMDKMNYPRGLIRFSTQQALDGNAPEHLSIRRLLRPRVLIYGALLLALSTAFVASLVLRTPLKVDVVRDRAALSRIATGGRLENVFRLQLMNATEQPQRYTIQARGLEGLTLLTDGVLDVGPAQARWVPVRLQIPYGSATAGSHPVWFEIRSEDGNTRVEEKSAFLVPR